MALKDEFLAQGNFLFKYRSFLPLIILLVAAFVYFHNYDILVLPVSRYYFELCCFGLCLFGFIIRAHVIGHAARNTSGRNTNEGQIAESINTKGMYSICRHPLYLGNFFIWLGLAAMTGHIWFAFAFVLSYWLYYERIMYAEEHFLTTKFGEAYSKFASSTPAFIPAIRQYVKPGVKFDWLRVLRQEKAGLLNLFSVVLLLKLPVVILMQDYKVIEPFWKYGFILVSIHYFLIKIFANNPTPK